MWGEGSYVGFSTVLGLILLYLDACGHAAGERNLGHIWVTAQELAGGSPTLHHVEKPLRDASFVVNLSQLHNSDGGEGRWLEDHGVT